MAFDGGGGRRVVSGGLPAGIESVRGRLARLERELWLVALAALAGDVLLTYIGLERGLTEANPVARAAIERFGYVALVGLKAGALAVGVAGWWLLPGRFGAVIPLALALPWSTAVVVNAVTLAAMA